MSSRDVHVILRADFSKFIEGMNRLAEAVRKVQGTPWWIGRRHHILETPARSAMHAEYDRRRRARRRRRA